MNKVCIADCRSCHIQVLNSDLTFSDTFGKCGNGKGQFQDPCAVTCDSAGNVYVVETGSNRIQVFSAYGKFLRMFGSWGTGRGKLNYCI